MGAHVSLNLLNELGKRDKMRGLSSILSLFRNKLNKFNNTRARMLDSIYCMALFHSQTRRHMINKVPSMIRVKPCHCLLKFELYLKTVYGSSTLLYISHC